MSGGGMFFDESTNAVLNSTTVSGNHASGGTNTRLGLANREEGTGGGLQLTKSSHVSVLHADLLSSSHAPALVGDSCYSLAHP
jgi:hypothetical protein